MREAHLGDRPREGRRDAEHLDAAREAAGVVDVRQEIAFDVDDRLEFRRAGEALGGEVGLPDDKRRLADMLVHHRVRHALAVMRDDARRVFEPLPTFPW